MTRLLSPPPATSRLADGHATRATDDALVRTVRLTPDGHPVEPGALAQGFPLPWPELRVEAVYVTVDPDTFRGRVLCGGVELGTTAPTDSEPEAIRLAEASIVEAVGRLFQPTPDGG